MSRCIRINAPYELVEGTVRRVSGGNRWLAIVELQARPGVIELSTGGAWVLRPGDSVAFLGRQDTQTGKFLAPCYRNITRGVRGRRPSEYTAIAYAIEGAFAALLFWGGAQLDLPFLWLLAGGVLLHMLFDVGELIEDVRYSRALRRHAAALAISSL